MTPIPPTTGSRTVLAVLTTTCFLAVWLCACADSRARAPSAADALETIRLPAPRVADGGPLMHLLEQRKSHRNFDEERKLSPQVLSDLLWAAWGVNRPDTGKRTAPSAMNWQEIDVYVALEEGLYRYNAVANQLVPVLAKDVRADTGRFFQPFVARAPVNLVYVADFSRVTLTGKIAVSEEEKLTYASATVGCIVQNVYLFCAEQGLSTVVRGLIHKPALREALGLGDRQKILLAQTVGYPSP